MAIPMEWVEKLFNCMSQFYGDRWDKYFVKPDVKEMAKIVWKNGLSGLTYDQIKFALLLCKRAALNKSEKAPHVIEFFHYAKGVNQPFINYHPKVNEKKCDPEIARKNLYEIKKKLGLPVKMEIFD